jgi:nitrogen fixation/metabolism regulation signal transduction histidine kinase
MIFLGLFLFFLMFAVAVMGAMRDRHLLTKQLEEEGVALARAYALSAENALILRGAGLSRVAGEAGRVPGVAFLVIVGPDCRVLAHSEPSRIGDTVWDEAIIQAFKTPIGAVEAGRTPIMAEDRDKVLRIVMPLVILDQVRGVMELGLRSDLIAEATLSTSRSAFLLALLAYLVGICFIVIFSNSLTKPLSLLSRAAERMSSGHLDVPVPIAGSDEVTRLAVAFEKMRSELAASFEGIRERASEIEHLRVFNENILNSIMAGVVTLDLDAAVRGMNQSAGRMLGLEPAQALGRPARLVFGAWPEVSQAIAGILGGRAMSLEVLVSSLADGADKRSHLLRIAGGPLLDESGKVAGDVLVFEDITHVRSMEKRMRDAEKMAAMGELAAGLAHEVRNPLGSIRNAAQFLEGKMEPTDPMIRFPCLIVGEADRLNALVTRLLEYTRPEGEEARPTDLRDVLERSILLAELKIAGSRIRITREYSEQRLPIKADQNRLMQAFVNLLFNAIEAIPAQGSISVLVRRGDIPGEVAVVIADSGPGFPPDCAERIFEPFFSMKEGGTGLGLAIVRQIIAEHGGRVHAANAAGRAGGAILTVILPLYREEEMHV